MSDPICRKEWENKQKAIANEIVSVVLMIVFLLTFGIYKIIKS